MHKYRKIDFPPAASADDGIVAVSRDINTDMILSAYTQGIFPWPFEEASVLWSSPDPRAVLNFSDFHIPRSTRKLFRGSKFKLKMNTSFDLVIQACADQKRRGQDGTWITQKMISAYNRLHKDGFAVSFETFNENDCLVGALYGVKIGRFFAGESMFHCVSGASKFALCGTVETLKQEGIAWIDIQMLTPLLSQFGAKEISRAEFLNRIQDSFADDLFRTD